MRPRIHPALRALASLGVLAVAALPAAAGPPTGVPFTRSPRGHILVPVTLADGITRSFALDTAAGSCVIPPDLARALGAAPREQRATLVGESGRSEHAVVTPGRVTVGDRSVDDLTALVQELPRGPAGVAPFEGILGAPFLRRFDVRIDFAQDVVTLFDPAAGDACPIRPGDSPGVPIVIREQGHILLPAGIGDVEVTALLDTGSGHSGINTLAAKELGAELPDAAPAGHGFAILAGPIRAAGRTLQERGQLAVMDRADIFGPLGLADRPRLLLGTDLLAGRVLSISYGAGLLFLE